MTKPPHQSTFYPRSKRPSRRNLLFALMKRLKAKRELKTKIPA